jgi:hypothetical protein
MSYLFSSTVCLKVSKVDRRSRWGMEYNGAHSNIAVQETVGCDRITPNRRIHSLPLLLLDVQLGLDTTCPYPDY